MAWEVTVVLKNSSDGASIPNVNQYQGEPLTGSSTLTKKIYRFDKEINANNFRDECNKIGKIMTTIRSL